VNGQLKYQRQKTHIKEQAQKTNETVEKKKEKLNKSPQEI